MPGELFYSFVALLIIVDPVGVAAIFAALTSGESKAYRRRMAIRGSVIAGGIMLAFAFAGDFLLRAMGISLPAFRIAGGVLLFLLATDMLLARPSGIRATTLAEREEAAQKQDISVFPVAIPLLAGPGALTSILLLMGKATTTTAQAGVIAVLFAVMSLTLITLLFAGQVMRLLGVTGANVVSRVLGIILAALAAQLVIDGVRASLIP